MYEDLRPTATFSTHSVFFFSSSRRVGLATQDLRLECNSWFQSAPTVILPLLASLPNSQAPGINTAKATSVVSSLRGLPGFADFPSRLLWIFVLPVWTVGALVARPCGPLWHLTSRKVIQDTDNLPLSNVQHISPGSA